MSWSIQPVATALASMRIEQLDPQEEAKGLEAFMALASSDTEAAASALCNVHDSSKKIALQTMCERGLWHCLRRVILSDSHFHFTNYLSYNEMTAICARHGRITCLEAILDEDVVTDYHAPLWNAAENGHADIVAIFLQKDKRLLHKKNQKQESLMHVAASTGSLALVTLLHQMGHERDSIDWSLLTPLDISSVKGFYEVTEFLIRSGYAISARGADKNTPLHYAAREGYTKLVALFSSCIHVKNRQGMTPLMCAACAGHESTVGALLDLGALIDEQDGDEETSLHKAIASKHIGVTRLLLQRGASPLIETKQKWTALHFATRQQDISFLQEVLLRDVAVNAPTETGETALHFAVLHGAFDHIAVLLRRGAHPQIPYQSKTPTIQLIYMQKEREARPVCDVFDVEVVAVGYNVFDAISLCLQHGASMNQVDCEQRTLLYLACEKKDHDCANFCLQNTADPNLKANTCTPLHVAVFQDDQTLAGMLLERGAEISIRDTILSRTPLQLALASEKYAMANFLLDRGASSDVTDIDGKSALHVLCEFCTDARGALIARRIIDSRQNPSIQDPKGNVSLHLINENIPYQVVTALIANQPFFDFANTNGDTPLAIAYRLGRQDLVSLYLAHGADPCIKNAKGLKPVEQLPLKHTACLQNLLSEFELLQRYFIESEKQKNMPMRYLKYGGLYLGSLLLQLGVSSFFGIPLLATPFAAIAPSALAIAKDAYADYNTIRRDQELQKLPAFVEDLYDRAVQIEALVFELRESPELLIQHKTAEANPLEPAFILGDFVLMQKLCEKLKSKFSVYRSALLQKYPAMNQTLLEECDLSFSNTHMTDMRFINLCRFRNSIIETIAKNLLLPIAKQKALPEQLLEALTRRLTMSLKKLLANPLHLGEVEEVPMGHLNQGCMKILDMIIPVQNPHEHEMKFLKIFWSLYTPHAVLDFLQTNSSLAFVHQTPSDQTFRDRLGRIVIRRDYLRGVLLTGDAPLLERL